MLCGAFIGAGGRARRAHYPALDRASDRLELRAIAELDETRLQDAADAYDVTGRYTDFRRMLDEVECDVVYAVMRPWDVTAVAVAVLDAGRHLFIEKPPGAGSADTERIAEAAERNGRLVCVGLQRRWTPMAREARARVEANGPIKLMLAGMHKHLLKNDQGGRRLNRLYEQDIHMVDFLRWVGGGTWDQVLTRGDDSYTGWMNTYNSIIHFSSGAVAVHTVTGHAGARHYRIELHGNGISAYLQPPQIAELYANDDPEPEIIRGQPIPADPEGRLDEGVDAMHQDFLACVVTGQQPLTNIHDVLHSVRLLEEIGRLDPHGQPLPSTDG